MPVLLARMMLRLARFSIWSCGIILLSAISLTGSSGFGIKFKQVTPTFIQAEGPHWDVERQVLFFIDDDGKALHKYDPQTGITTSTGLDGVPASMVPVEGYPDLFLGGLDADLVLLQWDGVSPDSSSSVLESVPRRLNDGKADARGRFWIGSVSDIDENGNPLGPPVASLYHYSLEKCRLEEDLRNIYLSNGIARSPDNRFMYYTDSPTYRIDVFDYDINTGRISNRRALFDFRANNVPGYPDSMTVDSEGNLWVTCYLGSRVIKIDTRDGRLLLSIVLPVIKPSSVAFGGLNLDILYVTTSRKNLTLAQIEEQPLAGSVLAVTGHGSTGLPANNAVLCNSHNTYDNARKSQYYYKGGR